MSDTSPSASQLSARILADRTYHFVNAGPSNNENQPVRGPHPSAGWLRQPAWIDGGVNPPQFYHTHEDIQSARSAALTGAFATLHPAQFGSSAGNGSESRQRFIPASVEGSPSLAMRDAAPVRNDTAPPVIEEIASSSTPTPLVAPAAPVNGDAPAIVDFAGHLVQVFLIFTLPTKGLGRGGKAVPKKERVTKSNYIVLEEISRVNFVSKVLGVHELADEYSPGINIGPGFKLWYTGSSGGKAGAVSVETDREFDIQLTALLRKNKKTCTVSVEIDIDTMDGFRSRKRPISAVQDAVGEDELLYGTKVPRMELFGDETQIQSGIVIQLRQKWPCQTHLGEHGETGYCYIAPTGEHIGLNMRRLKIWAAAIHANDASKHEPPNSIEFDGARDGRVVSARPRGRPSNQGSSSSIDASTMLMTAMLPLITSLADRQLSSALAAPAPPVIAPALPVAPAPAVEREQSLSPAPTAADELHACLVSFAAAKGIDVLGSEDVLSQLELTPDIISSVAVARLCELTGLVEGRVIKLQIFCNEWYARLQKKKVI